MSARFADKSVLVTGAGSGIGRATAWLFASEGARVLAVDLNDGVDETASGHGGIVAMRGDAGSEADVAAMIFAAIAQHGGIDIIAANAGISGGRGGLFELGEADWAALLRVNLIGPFLAIKHGAQAMLAAARAGAIKSSRPKSISISPFDTPLNAVFSIVLMIASPMIAVSREAQTTRTRNRLNASPLEK